MFKSISYLIELGCRLCKAVLCNEFFAYYYSIATNQQIKPS